MVQKDAGWSVEDIGEIALPAFQTGFTPLDRSPEVFSWDPI
jgi:hypothetical protein